MKAIADIPRLYTAFAEWGACLIFVILLHDRKLKRPELIAVSAAALIVQTLFLCLTGDALLVLWLPCMLAAVLLMYLYLRRTCNLRRKDTLYCTIQCFVAAEFAAALEWQIDCYLLPGYSGEAAAVSEKLHRFVPSFALMLAVYALVFGVLGRLLAGRLSREVSLHIKNRELVSAVVIGLAVFCISNLSFLSVNTPFSGAYHAEIANIRTLVTFGGVTLLYAHMTQCSEIRIRKELEAVQNVLQAQYMQYQLSRESIRLINYKYHDLKHQIQVLRSEEDSDKRNAFLNRMEEEIRDYEVQNKTGSKVLDTVLTGKSLTCRRDGINFTVVADGTLLDFMDTMDICSIFGNALDNAIECEKKIEDPEKRMIHLAVNRQKNFLMIRVGNYFEGTLRRSGGSLLTTKRDRRMHGYGLKSIQYTANKYGGEMHISEEDNWFELQILLPLETE